MLGTLFIYFAGFATLATAQAQPAPEMAAQGPELERLIQDLIADEAKMAAEAQEALKKMGPEVVPVLFDRLVTSGWDLKQPLLEVLGYHGLGTHALDWAKKKLLQGTDAEKTYAALLYELIDRSNHQDTPEFAAMVEVLLKALETEDKHLRAAAAFALVHGQETTVFFQHLHRIVPALISSFDSDLCVWRGGGGSNGVCACRHTGHARLPDRRQNGLHGFRTDVAQRFRGQPGREKRCLCTACAGQVARDAAPRASTPAGILDGMVGCPQAHDGGGDWQADY